MIDAPTRAAISPSLSVSERVRLQRAHASMRLMQMMRIDHHRVECETSITRVIQCDAEGRVTAVNH